MSNLDYPLSMLHCLLSELSNPHPESLKIVKRRPDKINGINRAIDILREEKKKEEKEKMKKLGFMNIKI